MPIAHFQVRQWSLFSRLSFLLVKSYRILMVFDLFKHLREFFHEKKGITNYSEEYDQMTLANIKWGRQQRFRCRQGEETKLCSWKGVQNQKINNEILNDHGVFHPKSLADELIFEPASNVVKGSDKHSWIMSWLTSSWNVKWYTIKNSVEEAS